MAALVGRWWCGSTGERMRAECGGSGERGVGKGYGGSGEGGAVAAVSGRAGESGGRRCRDGEQAVVRGWWAQGVRGGGQAVQWPAQGVAGPPGKRLR